METLISTVLSGLVLASLYAMMASGLSLIWTTLGVFNFAHGALMTVGAFIAWTVSEAAGLGPQFERQDARIRNESQDH